MALYDDIVALGMDITPATRDFGAIAAALSVGRTRRVKTSIGKGAILAALGQTAGNAFLDVVDAAPDFRHVKEIIARGEFDLSLDISQEGVQALVPAVLTQEQADALKNLAVQPDPISVQQVTQAFEGH